MCHHAKCCADRSNQIVRMMAAAILDFFRYQICNGPNGHEGRIASPCQISLKSLKLWPRYGNFSIFQNGGGRHVGFWNDKVLIVGRTISVELLHHAKFRGDWSSRCRDISILLFLGWWQPQSWIFFLQFYILTIQTVKKYEQRHCAKISRNHSNRGWDMAIFRFFKTAAAAILDLGNFKILTVVTVQRVELHQHAKFRQNRLNCGGVMAFIPFFKMAAAAVLDL